MERPFRAAGEQPAVHEPLQVMAQGGSGQIDVALDVPRRRASVSLLNDVPENGKPNGVPEGAELLRMAVDLRGHVLLLVFSK